MLCSVHEAYRHKIGHKILTFNLHVNPNQRHDRFIQGEYIPGKWGYCHVSCPVMDVSDCRVVAGPRKGQFILAKLLLYGQGMSQVSQLDFKCKRVKNWNPNPENPNLHCKKILNRIRNPNPTIFRPDCHSWFKRMLVGISLN